MNVIAWNARVLGKPNAFHELRRLVVDNSPDILFISETKLKTKKCDNWRARLNMGGWFMVDSEGASGGLILAWKNYLNVNVRSYSKGHIDTLITDNAHKIWRVTGFYGNPEVANRKFSWDLLRRLGEDAECKDIPWIVGGDFNEILFTHEKSKKSVADG